MGSGGSRLNPEHEVIPAKLHPLLRRRIEEIRRRIHSGGGKHVTPSGTELLLNQDGKAKVDDDNDDVANSLTSCVTSEDSKGFTAAREEAGDPRREESAKEKNEGGKKEQAAMGNVESESENDAKKDVCHDNKDDEGIHDNEDSIMFPGSPSFRIYYADNLHEHDEDDDDFNDAGKKDNCADEKTSTDHGTRQEKNLQDSEPKKPKKDRKRSFRKVIPKGGQTAMKNLFNVKACYNPSCSSHDRTHLLTAKTPA
ncbi:hypothetical protein Vadar_026964 [Vaccinium darrowii]|uniref:Uncharacterized protein n=1 Tax=Vaccinium darrowii TaxID=229202 RepID=A0ACB7ZN68_9ERIC|nr:hypothetical protein Vadar_026964 [Vaccinium darrowii]